MGTSASRSENMEDKQTIKKRDKEPNVAEVVEGLATVIPREDFSVGAGKSINYKPHATNGVNCIIVCLRGSVTRAMEEAVKGLGVVFRSHSLPKQGEFKE